MPAPNEKPVNRSVGDWMKAIDNGEICKPRWQRGIVWRDGQVCELFKALFNKRPVGALLTLSCNRNSNPNVFSLLPLEGATLNPNSSPDTMILDGQQRLTALWHVFNDKFLETNPPKAFFAKVTKSPAPDGWRKVVDVEVRRKNKKDAKLFDDPSMAWNGLNNAEKTEFGWVPLSILGKPEVPGGKTAIKEWCKRAIGQESQRNIDEYEDLVSSLDHLAQNLISRDISYYELDPEISFDDAIDAFIATNESSSTIKKFDIVVAEIESSKIEANLERGLRRRISEINIAPDRQSRFFGQDSEGRIPVIGNLLLKITCCLCNETPTEGNFRKSSVQEKLIDDWNEIVLGLDWTLEFIEQQGIRDEKRLPSTVPLRVLPALYPYLPPKSRPATYGEAIRTLRKYLWRSFLSDRYAGSANTRLFEDYKGLRRFIQNLTNNNPETVETPILNESIYSCEELLKNLGKLDGTIIKPAGKDSKARAVLATSLFHGARDFGSGEVITNGNISNREYHHLFPRALLGNLKLSDKDINHVLNFVLISAPTNKISGSTTPKNYLEKWSQSPIDPETLKSRVESHSVPFDALDVEKVTKKTYSDFIANRAEMMVVTLRGCWNGDERTVPPSQT